MLTDHCYYDFDADRFKKNGIGFVQQSFHDEGSFEVNIKIMKESNASHEKNPIMTHQLYQKGGEKVN